MKITGRAGQFLSKTKFATAYRRSLRIIGTGALTLLLTLNGLPAERGFVVVNRVDAQTATTLTFTPDADAYVKQSSPSTNYGIASSLQVNGASNPDIESFLRFTVTGVSGTVQNARLRLYTTTNGTRNGPAVYATEAAWAETGLNWNNRPARTSQAADNKGTLRTNAWVEYDVTPLVTGNGTISFVLAADSSDGVRFSSRQGKQPPQLVITLSSAENTPTNTETSTPTSTDTLTPTSTDTLTPTSTDTSTSTLTPSPTETSTFTPTSTSSPTVTLTPTSSSSAVFVGAGDISTCSSNNDEATAKLLDNISGTVFTAGDNAYTDGSYTEYLNCYDPTWGRHKARTRPVPGNHEYLTLNAAGYFQYFNNVPAYYAFNLGAWRIYALNSELAVSATSAQVAWLQADLAANPSQCVLAYWHKPRWSSGSNHGSSSAMQTLWQVLYDAGAELIISGHEHNYERFAEMNASGAAASPGLREIVVGTGGASLYPFGTALSTSQVRNNSTYGVLELTLRPGGYDWQFVPVAGSTFTDRGSGTCH
ncbi:MAG TPA: DNRLRE domain-containing protein [Anaerolineales bacterium]|nr:DNRLRE domain-containing protein [Anaerolineales bacterium]